MRNPFKRRVVLPTIGVEVRLLADSGNATEMLGITRERFEELIAVIVAAEKTGPKSPYEIIAAVSKICVHPNELAFCSFTLGALYERRLNPLQV